MKQHAYGFNQRDSQLWAARLFCKSRGGIEDIAGSCLCSILISR